MAAPITGSGVTRVGSAAAPMAGLSGYGQIALAGLQLYSGLAQASYIKQQAGLQNRLDDMNFRAAEIDAFEAEKMGYSTVARYQTVIDSTIATQQVAFASENVDITSGTAAEIQKESKVAGMLNQLDMIKEARNRAMGFKDEAASIRLRQSFRSTQAAADAFGARVGAITGAASTGLSGYSKLG